MIYFFWLQKFQELYVLQKNYSYEVEKELWFEFASCMLI